MTRMGPEAQSLQDPVEDSSFKGKRGKGQKRPVDRGDKKGQIDGLAPNPTRPFLPIPDQAHPRTSQGVFPAPQVARTQGGRGGRRRDGTLTRRAIHHNGRRHLFCLGSLGRSVGHHRHQHHPPTPDTRELGQPGPGRTDRAELTCVRHCRCGHDDGTLLVLSANKHKHKKKQKYPREPTLHLAASRGQPHQSGGFDAGSEMSGTLGKLAARSPPSSRNFVPDGGSQRGQVSVLALLSPHSARVSDLVGTSPGRSSAQRPAPSTLQKVREELPEAGSSRGPSPSPLASAPGGGEEATQEASQDRTGEKGGNPD